MAEWLGQQVADWPGWLALVAVIVFAVLALFYAIFFESAADIFWEQRRNRKKREKELHHAKK